VVFKGLIAAATAVALSATPAIAAGNQSAAAARAASVEVAPAGETVEGDSELFRRGGFIIPLLVIAVILLGIYVAVDDNGNNPPVSPG
jgi:hypothetical protein